MLDVHAIAIDYRANPITRWVVRAVACGTEMGEVVLRDGSFRARGPAETETRHPSLKAARDHLAGSHARSC